MIFSRGARSPRQALSRPSGVVNFAEGNTHASGSEDLLCCRHWVMRCWVVEDKATVRFERSLLAGAQHEGAGARSVDGFCGSEDPVIGS